MKQPTKYSLIGLCAGMLNGMFGAGGGMIVVPMLRKSGLPARHAHATSIVIIASLSLLSSSAYLFSKEVLVSDVLWFLPTGIIGAVLGALLLRKIQTDLLRRIFGGVMIVSAIRLLLR